MKFVFTAVASALLLSATPAMAADGTGFYVGAGVGSMGVDVGDFSGNDTSFKIFGGWDFNPYLGGELEYIDGGSAEDYGMKVDVTGFNASVKGQYPFTEQFSAFAKLGMIFWDADFGGMISGSDSGEDFSWGVGAAYDFTDNFGGRIEYQGFEIKDTDTVDLFSASLVYKF